MTTCVKLGSHLLFNLCGWDNTVRSWDVDLKWIDQVHRISWLPDDWATALTHESIDERSSSSLFRWTSEWADVIDFQIEPVLRDHEAGPILKEMMEAR